jgi:2-polyprenyl-6-hydroxyphenyl methylase/3-demethylubiquinone-9 3-methyltransferase
MLHWLAAARARLIPVAARPGEILVDLGCGGVSQRGRGQPG